MVGGCDGPLGMAKEANGDALAAIWRRGNLGQKAGKKKTEARENLKDYKKEYRYFRITC